MTYLTLYWSILLTLAAAVGVLYLARRSEHDIGLPAPLKWIGDHPVWVWAGLGVTALVPVAWQLAAGLAGVLGAGEGARRVRSDDSELPPRDDSPKVEPSHDVQEQVGGAEGAVLGDEAEGGPAEDFESSASELQEVRE